MKKIKEQKAITLVALIITIIVLLILAVVSITTLSGDHIIQHAENAKDAYQNASITEKNQLQNYETLLNQKVSKSKIFNMIQNSSQTTINVEGNNTVLYQYAYTGEIVSMKLNGSNYLTLDDGTIIMGTKNGEIFHTNLENYDTYKIAKEQKNEANNYLLKVAAEPTISDFTTTIEVTIEITFSDGTTIVDHCIFLFENQAIAIP